MEKKVRVRFAPSPTGPLHMGGIRTALYNYLFARKHGGDFLLRIEDTDQNRYVPGAENYIVEALRWCGIPPNEGAGFGDGPFSPYRQSERKEHYRLYAEQLVQQGSAYYAFDTPEELDALRERLKAEKSAVQQYGPSTREGMNNSLSLDKEEVRSRIERGEPYVIRMKMPASGEVVFRDIIRGEVRVQTATLDDKVLFKSDGMPTYHLANVVDDHLMEISHVIRGEEWLPSTPLHVLLYRLFGWEQPEFAHLPLLLKPDGNGKLSKRDGDRLGFPVFPLEWKDPISGETSSGYREKGFFPEAFINMLALLGWSPADEREIMNLRELTEAFQLEKVHKAGSKYNYEKALWFNQQYLQQQSDHELAGLFLPLLAEKGVQASEAFTTRVAGLVKERCSLSADLWEQSWFFFLRPESYDTESVKKKWDAGKKAFFDKVIQLFESDQALWAADAASSPEPVPGEQLLEEKFKALMQEEGLKPGEVMLPLRIMLTGGKFGPAVFSIAALLGREETIYRIRTALPAFD
ncbi:glutamyl-tRNA synthetase [Anseongella ginsenosidimutans]|uniref:Glutamate--tRNA ligase n=1 Tax=Anseongella ginsenosidimutans TaxID=496056 RepID=A0A4R3KXI6_9SPHI|nr:glutamate--tRNA ligase [Anseongella ginsenosidimutans]QEC51808.1 glutamate--tRNA ligase [Anseongella ginsenosidimutans]TCS89180.1 glutamyl-tRNA synthetase [Anseongella ginsenosidimutans]